MFRWLTAGESHGRALAAICDGVPAGVAVTSGDVADALARRRAGYGRGARMKIEADAVEILSGVRAGETLGAPIALLIPNRDWEHGVEVMAPEPGESLTPGGSPGLPPPREQVRQRQRHAVGRVARRGGTREPQQLLHHIADLRLHRAATPRARRRPSHRGAGGRIGARAGRGATSLMLV